jgi:hypothetical protein
MLLWLVSSKFPTDGGWSPPNLKAGLADFRANFSRMRGKNLQAYWRTAKFLTMQAAKFAEKTCAWAYVNRP